MNLPPASVKRSILVFALVFIGLFSTNVLLVFFFGWSPPRGLSTGIFGMAAVMAGGSFAKKNLRAFNTGEYIRVLLGCTLVDILARLVMLAIVISSLDLTSALAKNFITTTFIHSALLALLLSPFVVKSFALNYQKRAAKEKAKARHRTNDSNTPMPPKSIPDDTPIPLTLGIANLSGGDLAALATKDARALAPLFQHTRIVEAPNIPRAEVLFIYTHLNPDGTLKDRDTSGIRQIVQITGASLLVVSSPNPSSAISNALALPGPKTASLVFTIDRNGDGFTRMFDELFQDMRTGTSLLSAWAKLMPQHPDAMPSYAPQTILVAEGGDLAFPPPRHAGAGAH